MVCSQFHPQSPADAAVEAITVSLVVPARQEGLESASGRTRAVTVKENTVKYVPSACQILMDSERRGEGNLQE